MPGIPEIYSSKYNYSLPQDRIAMFPLPERAASKLLIYKDQVIKKSVFLSLPDLVESGSLFVFNDTRVVPARLIFKKSTGAEIEIFCLEPYAPSDYHKSLTSCGKVCWHCLVGNKKRWKTGHLQATGNYNGNKILLDAFMVKDNGDSGIIEFSWNPDNVSFNDILGVFGRVPLPPYIPREADEYDVMRYQTVYANTVGSVAAPTAGLHFTPEVFDQLRLHKLDYTFLTLHVGAGTFRPVTAANIADHKMHHEWVSVSVKTIERLLDNSYRNIIPVGTTSVRTLESLYWYGVCLIKNQGKYIDFNITQWLPYIGNLPENISRKESLEAVLDVMKNKNIDNICGNTELMIVPGYKYRMADAMVTNFHQPGSTLLMLVAAFIGDKWEDVYSFALDNDFRFLSYGDACLLFPQNN